MIYQRQRDRNNARNLTQAFLLDRDVLGPAESTSDKITLLKDLAIADNCAEPSSSLNK